jgi:hypothetical protein
MMMETFWDSIASQQPDLRRTDDISARIRATFWIQSQPVACYSLIRGFVARCKFLKNIQKPSVPFNFFKVYVNATKHIGNSTLMNQSIASVRKVDRKLFQCQSWGFSSKYSKQCRESNRESMPTVSFPMDPAVSS